MVISCKNNYAAGNFKLFAMSPENLQKFSNYTITNNAVRNICNRAI
jgi:hypothetical protein